MFQFMLRSIMVLTLVVSLIGTTTLARAQTSYPTKEQTIEPSAEGIAADVLLLRPVGFMAMVVGTVLFVISLPISLPTRSADVVAQKLVVNPAKYTFVRPLGVPEAGSELDITR
jgi:hypothetical protein